MGLQAILMRFRTTKREAFFVLRLIAGMLEKADEGKRLLKHVAGLVQSQLKDLNGGEATAGG